MPWDEISGQEGSVSFLRAALARGRAHHAYLFAGPKGVGKELLARLFAQAANCEAEERASPATGGAPEARSIGGERASPAGGAPEARSIGDDRRPCGTCASC